MKKHALVTAAFLLIIISVFAQDEENEKGFKKENLFTGGSVTVSFFNGQTVLGANPFFGYKLANWIDAGVAFNYVYSSSRYYNVPDDKLRITTYGPGVFTRLYPISFLFAQAQYEHNYSIAKYTAVPGTGYQDDKLKVNSSSLLLGAGFAQGRSEGNNTFYYISVLFDVLKNMYSPYVNVINPDTPQQRVIMTPIIRAGFNIALFRNKYK